ncbi:MAG: pseudouridine synthase [Candidatus Omnitrophota bacterium]
MKTRLQTILAHAGIASRRGVVSLIQTGKVTVNGKIVVEKGFRVDPNECDIQVKGQALTNQEKKYYFLFNKPKGVISTAIDTHNRRKITDFFKDIPARLYPVGRLDKDTTGAIIVTNDGALTHKFSHPSFEIEKEYVAEVTPCVSKSDIKKIEKGIKLEGKYTAPCGIKFIKENKNSAVYRIILHEGRKRQIKRMFEEVGSKVVNLKREKYAGLSLGTLKEGEYRPIYNQIFPPLKKVARGISNANLTSFSPL